MTGGGSGIGFETAKLLSQKGNKVLILGRTAETLHQAAALLPNTIALPCDITKPDEVDNLLALLATDYADLSVLVNNAGKAFVYTHAEGVDAIEKARQEMDTNYFALIRLTEKLLPVLKKQSEAAIVNVSSIVAFTPASIIPAYSDSKAAVHSNTLTLRHTLAKDTSICVFELMPPTVNTAFSKDIGGEAHGMPAEEVAQGLINGLESDTYEIYVGLTTTFRDYFFANPAEAFNLLNMA
nr:SDR family NAD(P)-dependent oxidoreductase [Spirosoma sp. KNUC1025]